MVNVTLTSHGENLRELAFSYAPPDRREALKALFALDAALGQVLRSTREPMVGQMRLAWWREALVALDTAPPPGEPVLQALAAEVLPLGISGAELAAMIDGWESLLGELGQQAIEDHGKFRGTALFAIAGRVLNAAQSDPVAIAGYGWSLADLARNLSETELVAGINEKARQALDTASRTRWSRAGRPLGALVLLARRDDSGTVAISTVFRLAWHRLTGR